MRTHDLHDGGEGAKEQATVIGENEPLDFCDGVVAKIVTPFSDVVAGVVGFPDCDTFLDQANLRLFGCGGGEHNHSVADALKLPNIFEDVALDLAAGIVVDKECECLHGPHHSAAPLAVAMCVCLQGER